MIVSKTNRDGIDTVVEALQQKFYAQLLGYWDLASVYTMYPRANKIFKDDQIKPEISLSNSENLPTLYDDKVSVNSFFLRSDSNVWQDANHQIKSTLSIIFQADLDALYGDTERVDEVFNMDVLRILKKEQKYITGDITFVVGVDNVYNDLTLTGEFKDKIKHSDIGKRHVVKFTFDVLYNLDCSRTAAPVCAPVQINVNGALMTGTESGTTVNVTIVDGNSDPQGVETPPGSFNYIVPTGAGAPAINTANLFKTGAASWLTNDDGDQAFGRGVSFLTLDFNNPFGNTSRLTDDLGTQIYTSNIVVDWATHNQIDSTVLCYYLTLEVAATVTTHMTNQPFTKATFTEWYICNGNQLNNLFNYSVFRNYLNYAPFNHIIVGTATRVWTSTMENAVNGIQYTGISMTAAGGATVSQAMLCRTFTLTELGL